MQILNVSIDLNKIDKNKIKPHANGAKYYSLDIIIKDEPDQYGQQVAVKNNQTKEERESGEKPTYIGNGKIVFTKAPEGGSVPPPINEQKNSGEFNDLPF